MAIASIDHVALPCRNPAVTMEFYAALGFDVPDEQLWRGVERPRRLFVACGDQKINFHVPEEWQNPAFTLRAPQATPGCGDLCFVWHGSLESLTDKLARLGLTTEVGPVERAGGRDHGRTTGTSVYIRDPDNNLLEFIVYAPD